MSASEREIIRQAPTHPGMQVVDDDRWKSRWLWNAGAPIGLSEYTMSRFIGKFEDDVLPAKRPVCLEPHMARSIGVYEHRAFIGTNADMGGNHADTMLSVPMNSVNPNSGIGSAAPLTSYDNNPKLCAYLLMRDYERRGLCLFEDLRGVEEEEFNFLFDLIIPPSVEKQWAKTKRVVLDHEFKGPFLDQYKEWLGAKFSSPMLTWFNANIGAIARKGLERRSSDLHGSMVTQLRAAVNRAWAWENSVLNTTEQQIRRYRNGHKGKEFYDMPDERFVNPVPPLDLLCLADTSRQPIDLQQVEAANKLNTGTQEAMMAGMEVFADRIAEKMAPGASAADIEALIERKMAERDAEWKAKIEELRATPEPPAPQM